MDNEKMLQMLQTMHIRLVNIEESVVEMQKLQMESTHNIHDFCVMITDVVEKGIQINYSKLRPIVADLTYLVTKFEKEMAFLKNGDFLSSLEINRNGMNALRTVLNEGAPVRNIRTPTAAGKVSKAKMRKAVKEVANSKSEKPTK